MSADAMTMVANSLEIPLRECEPWCVAGQDRHAKDHPDDRDCVSDWHEVPLSLHDPVKMCEDTWSRDWIDVNLRRPQEGRPQVWLNWETTNGVEIKLSLGEAAALRDALTNLLGEAGR